MKVALRFDHGNKRERAQEPSPCSVFTDIIRSSSNNDSHAAHWLSARHVENTPWLNTLQECVFPVMEIRETFAANLLKYRRAARLSQEELAHRAQIDRTYISALERCVYAASIEVVDRLARELGVEASDLLVRFSPPGHEA